MPDLPASMRMNSALDRWIAINRDDTITIRSGKAELGQGIKTALTLIAADELDVDPSRIRLETADTRSSPNEFITAGSMSVETSGAAVRQACAQARRILISKASEALGVDAASLAVEDGQITGPGANRSVSYSDLMGGEVFEIEVVEREPRGSRRWCMNRRLEAIRGLALRGLDGARSGHELESPSQV